MTAKIIMVIDDEKYEYGTYPFETYEQQNKVNGIAERIRLERDCDTYVEIVGE